jgi:hypothetical protein
MSKIGFLLGKEGGLDSNLEYRDTSNLQISVNLEERSDEGESDPERKRHFVPRQSL